MVFSPITSIAAFVIIFNEQYFSTISLNAFVYKANVSLIVFNYVRCSVHPVFGFCVSEAQVGEMPENIHHVEKKIN